MKELTYTKELMREERVTNGKWLQKATEILEVQYFTEKYCAT